jgi:hypothetical protein
MQNWTRLAARYGRMTWQQRLGNLASTLARSATVSQQHATSLLVPDLLREAMWIVEWSAADTPLSIMAELAPLQLELGLLRLAWERDALAIQSLLAYRTRNMSERVLEMSGLLVDETGAQ